MQILYIIVGIIVVWLSIVTFLVVSVKIFFNKLGKSINKGNLVEVLNDILKTEKKNQLEIVDIKKEILSVVEKDRLHLQKVGLVKFNPFEEVGGEHSFSLCLLDGFDNGVVLTGLHTRDRTRAYLKEVKKGKAQVELSKEETKALKIALKS